MRPQGCQSNQASLWTGGCLFALTVGLTLVFAAPAFAATYYVRKTGNDANTCTSIWLTEPGWDYGSWTLGRVKLMTALRRVRRSRPSKPSIGLSEGSSWQARVTRRSVCSKIRSRGITTSGTNSLPLAVSVSRNAVDLAGLQAARLQLHRLDPSRPIRTMAAAVTFIKEPRTRPRPLHRPQQPAHAGGSHCRSDSSRQLDGAS